MSKHRETGHLVERSQMVRAPGPTEEGESK